MRIFQPALDRLVQSKLTGEQLREIVEGLLKGINEYGFPGGSLNLQYAKDDEKPGPDELVPIITITLAPVAAIVPGDITGRQVDGKQPGP